MAFELKEVLYVPRNPSHSHRTKKAGINIPNPAQQAIHSDIVLRQREWGAFTAAVFPQDAIEGNLPFWKW
jgi:hypothetical protein